MSRKTFLSELVSQKDNIQIEFHSEYNLEKLLISVCAFLNTDGGWIIVGHSGNKIHGIEGDIETLSDNLKSEISERIIPQPITYVQNETIDNKDIILINILRGTRAPYSFNKKYYIRKSKRSIEANQDEISSLLRKPLEFMATWEKLSVIDATEDDMDIIEINETINLSIQLNRGKSLPNEALNFLNYFQLYDFGSVKNGAMALYGKSPIRFLSQLRTRITVMAEGRIGNQYADTLIIEDNLFSTFSKVKDYFKKQLPVVSDFKYNEWDRVDRERYPLDALDEAVVNAMVHRDYGDVSSEVVIDVFPDRIEITNSGEIPEGILKTKSSFELYQPVFRNPMVAHNFFLRGKMEKKGRGLALIRDLFLDWGLKTPEWISDNGFTTVRLFGVPASNELNDRMKKFLNTLKTGSRFSRDDYEKYFKGQISEKTARLDISKLVEGGWLSRISDGPATSYVRTSKKLPDITG